MTVRSIPVDPANANHPRLYLTMTVYDPAIAGTKTLSFSEETIKSVGGTVLRRGLVSSAGTLALDLIAAWGKGVAPFGIGEVVLINTNGALESMRDYIFDGYGVTIEFGTVALTGTLTRTTVATGIMEQPDFGKRTVNIPVRSTFYSLDQSILSTTFAGTGGLEGDTNIKGTLKPRVYGLVSNVPLILVDSVNLIYLVSDRPCLVDTLYDGGLPLTFDATGPGVSHQYTNLAAFNATTPAPGHYTAYWTAGTVTCFKLGSQPVGELTLAIAGDMSAGVIDAALRTVIDKLVTDAGIATSSNVINDMYYPAPISGAGFYVADDRTFATALTDLCGNYSAWLWFNTVDNAFVVGQLPKVDSTGVVYAVLRDSDIIDMKKLGNPRTPGEGVPPWSVSVDYMRVETVQTSGLGAAVGASWRQFVGQQFRSLNKQDAAVKAIYPLAQQLRVTGNGFNLNGTFPIPSNAEVQSFLDDFWTALQLNYHYYQIDVKLTKALLQQYTLASGKHWIPASMPAFLTARLGIRTARFGFTNTGKGTAVAPMALSVDLANRRVSYIVRTTYQVG